MHLQAGTILLAALGAAHAGVAQSSNASWSQLWLAYNPVSEQFASQLNYSTVQCVGSGDLLARACSELATGLSAMLRRNLTASTVGSSAVIINVTGQKMQPIWPPDPTLQGFNITVTQGGDTVIGAQSAQGALYGAFRFLNAVAREASALLVPGIVESTTPNVREVS
jgi:alpha-glucuronidase